MCIQPCHISLDYFKKTRALNHTHTPYVAASLLKWRINSLVHLSCSGYRPYMAYVVPLQPKFWSCRSYFLSSVTDKYLKPHMRQLSTRAQLENIQCSVEGSGWGCALYDIKQTGSKQPDSPKHGLMQYHIGASFLIASLKAAHMVIQGDARMLFGSH